MNNVKVYTANSTTYLGIREKSVIVGLQIQNTTVTQDVCADYFKAVQMGEVLNIEVGKNTDVICRELSRREKLNFSAVSAEFEEAKVLAEDWLVTKVFDEFRNSGKQ